MIGTSHMQFHHISIRTADIFRSIQFYEQLGFELETRFTTGFTLACWLQGFGIRLELIQIPEPRPAADLFHDPHYVGYYHLSLSVDSLQETLLKITATRLLDPTLQNIGDQTYQIAFIADPDGLPIELMELQARNTLDPGLNKL